jgi:NADH:ubiquinone oxidoreductase subunit F (NADH-binding)
MSTAIQSPRLLPDARVAEDLAAHEAVFGRRPSTAPETTVTALEASGLRGRGGAAFPTGTKWRAVMEHARESGAVVVANAAECEPASLKDRTLIALRPHLVLDGLEHAAQAVGARRAIVYTSRSHAQSVRTLAAAIAERRRRGDSDLFIEIVSGPNRYVAGEETALMARVSGRLAKPRVVPPRPFQSGVDGMPTLVQNVETLAHAALVARFGPEWFRTAGTARAPGTVLLTVTGAVGAPGVFETDCRTTVSEVVACAGGPVGEPAAVLIGGYFGRWVQAGAVWDTPFDADSPRDTGASVGAGVVAVLPAAACGVVETDRVLTYLAGETAGQCGPCHVGLPAIARLFHEVTIGTARPSGLDVLERWSSDVLGRGACRHPDGAMFFLSSALRVFAADLRHHLRHGACRFTANVPHLPIPARDKGWW